MPVKHPDPFASSAERLNPAVNPYVSRMLTGAASGDLPLAFGDTLRDFPGNWRQKLAARRGGAPATRLVAEIGCHKGQTLLAMAADHPDTAFIGLDITYKRVVTTAERICRHQRLNAMSAMANASALDLLFKGGELDGVVIFFPDPWVKKERQAKHRLVDPAFSARLRTVLAPGGFVWLKTDQEIYFEGADQALTAAGLTRQTDVSLPLGRDYGSAFEHRYRLQNLPIFSGIYLNLQ